MEEWKEDKIENGATIHIRPNYGPVTITGNFTIIGEDGKEMPKKEKVSICRCGLSKTQPICDGTHKCRPE